MKDRLKATILGLAYADALGAGYEFFKGTIGEDESIDFFEIPKITAHKKYEWTDDTAMTYLTLLAMKHDHSDENSMELNVDYELLSNLFIDWYKGAPDKGLHTYNVLYQTEESKKTNANVKYKLEAALAKKYCNNGFLVYSDMHKECKKCRPN